MIMTSFISERTAEYVVVPSMAKILSNAYGKVIPLFFWVSREGGNVSKNSFNEMVRVVALYARRPKLNHVFDDNIQIKFNQILFDRRDFFYEKGITTLCGAPICNSLSSFAYETSIKWFYLKAHGNETTIDFEINNLSRKITNENVVILNENEVLEIVKNESQLMRWDDAINTIRELKNRGKQYARWGYVSGLFGDLYKPVFLVLV